MRHIFLLIGIALLMTACGQVSERGEQLGNRLAKSWGDTTAIRSIDREYQSAADSMYIPGTAGQLAAAFMRAAGGGDSLQAVAQVIALNASDFADEHAQPLIDGLLNGSLDARHATDRLFLLHWAAELVGKDDHVAKLDEAIDYAASRLSDKKQMLLYSRAATPDALGKQMRAERSQPDADTALIDRRAEMLRDIYDEAQFKEFQSAYNQ